MEPGRERHPRFISLMIALVHIPATLHIRDTAIIKIYCDGARSVMV